MGLFSLHYSNKFLNCRSFLRKHFKSLDFFEKICSVLGSSELWDDDLSSMLDLVKDYIVNVWKLRKAMLYDENLSIPQSQC